MIRLASLLAPVAVSLTLAAQATAPAAAQTADPVAALRDALVGAGCIMTQANQNQVLSASGLAAPAAIEALGVLIGAGEALSEGDTIRLASGACAGVGGGAPDMEELAARSARVAEALAARGCRVNDRESAAFARDLNMAETDMIATLLALVGTGAARIDRDGAIETIVLTAPPCDVAAAPPSPPPALSK